MTVETDDPAAYVKALEPECELEVYTTEDGTLVVQTGHNGLWIKYEFSADD